MQIHRNEISTGILVLVTMGILGAVLVMIGMPGVIRPLNTFHISFDNASGVHPGDPVLLAGRQIGEVTELFSPMPMANRPKGHEDYEVSIEVKVDAAAQVRKHVTARLYQQGLMGQLVIDFIQGDESSPVAPNNFVFVGERVPQITELISNNLESLTGEKSDIAIAARNIRQLTETLKKEPWRLLSKSTGAAPTKDTERIKNSYR